MPSKQKKVFKPKYFQKPTSNIIVHCNYTILIKILLIAKTTFSILMSTSSCKTRSLRLSCKPDRCLSKSIFRIRSARSSVNNVGLRSDLKASSSSSCCLRNRMISRIISLEIEVEYLENSKKRLY